MGCALQGELRVQLEEPGGERGSESEPLVNALPHRRGAEDGERGSGARRVAHRFVSDRGTEATSPGVGPRADEVDACGRVGQQGGGGGDRIVCHPADEVAPSTVWFESNDGENAGDPVGLLRPLTEPRGENLAVLVEGRGVLDRRDLQLGGHGHVSQRGELCGHRRFIAPVFEARVQKEAREIVMHPWGPVPRARQGALPQCIPPLLHQETAPPFGGGTSDNRVVVPDRRTPDRPRDLVVEPFDCAASSPPRQ